VIKNWFCVVLGAVLGVMAANAAGKTLVREFSGSRSANTADFEVQAPWIMDWRVAGDFPHMLAIDVALVDADTGVHQGRVLKTKWAGNGVRMFNEGGHYRFQVTSALVRWTLKVEQITQEEAELYSPKRITPQEESERPGTLKTDAQ